MGRCASESEAVFGIVPEENRFALASAGEGIALFRATGHGLVSEFSKDAVHWRPAQPKGDDARRLWPLCSGESVDGTDLFCVTDRGDIVAVAHDDVSAAAPAGTVPIPEAGEWYDAPPAPHDVIIVQGRDDRRYRALFCARRSGGRRPERRACIGLAHSVDLRTWSVEPPVFAPNRYARMFSPHLCGEPGRTVLFYATAEQGGVRALRYALAPDPDGPYERTDPDMLSCDARAMIHTVGLANRRLVFFGRALPRQLHLASVSRPGVLRFLPDGRLAVMFYEGLLSLLGRTLFQTDADLASDEPLARIAPAHAANARFTVRMQSESAPAAGLLMRAAVGGHDNVTLWLDFAEGAVLLRRGLQGRLLGRADRELQQGRDYRVAVWAEGAFMDVFLDDEWILTSHTGTRRAGAFGFVVRGGVARFREATAQTIGEA